MILLWVHLALADAQSDFEQGILALRSEDAVSAEQSFRSALEQGGVDPAVYHGLGNALYRQGQTGAAVAAWQRGLELRPEDPDLSYNLSHFRGDQDDNYKAFPVSTLTPACWAFAAALGFAIGLAVLLGWPKKRLLWAGSALLSLGLGLTAVFRPSAQVGAVMVLPSVLATSMPEGAGLELFSLSAGVDVRILEESAGSYRIELGNGERGWIPRESLILSTPNSPFQIQ